MKSMMSDRYDRSALFYNYFNEMDIRLQYVPEFSQFFFKNRRIKSNISMFYFFPIYFKITSIYGLFKVTNM